MANHKIGHSRVMKPKHRIICRRCGVPHVSVPRVGETANVIMDGIVDVFQTTPIVPVRLVLVRVQKIGAHCTKMFVRRKDPEKSLRQIFALESWIAFLPGF